uniref:Uncharacterized protein n=1 Tax=Oryza brachyantha TaxID=4533 RepID=J3N065_ORYBR
PRWYFILVTLDVPKTISNFHYMNDGFIHCLFLRKYHLASETLIPHRSVKRDQTVEQSERTARAFITLI